jgi:hypothetical protein
MNDGNLVATLRVATKTHLPSLPWPVLLWIALGAAWCPVAVQASESPESPSPPWEPAYKIKAHETHRLTPADVVGPDGIVYPDWRYAGVPGGIPSLPERARVEDFGATADDGRDDAPAIQQGAEAVAQRGGGALVLGPGTYHLDRPVIVARDGVVICGRGADATRLVFRYGPPDGGVGFFSPQQGATLGPDAPIEVHAQPEGLQRIAIRFGERTLAERARHAHWGGTFMLRTFGASLGEKPLDAATLTAVAEWSGGRRAQAEVTVRYDPQHELPGPSRRMPSHGLAAIMFHGGEEGPAIELAEDGKRGDLEIVLAAEPALRPGDAVELEAPATPRWNRLVKNACQWGTYRRGQFRVEEVRGSRVRLNQPLRIEFPVVDGSTARKLDPVRRCGVEDLTLEQTRPLWTCGVLFSGAWECWARGVKVVKAGRHPVYTRFAKWCEIRDCQFDDAWYHGGGGTAYVGWERSYDCLMENVTTWKMRHAPCVQWSSSGNVVRKSTFHGSDAQWHAGWTNENLFEQCTVDAAGSHGTYGHGGWASPPGDAAHGPEGPRNVLFNCDLRAPRTGLWMGGMNENWLILYNRLIAKAGPGVFAQGASFDHVIRGNAIAVGAANKPAVQLASPDCVGVEIVENRIYGAGGIVVGGLAKPAVERDNTVAPFDPEPPRPEPAVPSIFAWQRAQQRPAKRASQ